MGGELCVCVVVVGGGGGAREETKGMLPTSPL